MNQNTHLLLSIFKFWHNYDNEWEKENLNYLQTAALNKIAKFPVVKVFCDKNFKRETGNFCWVVEVYDTVLFNLFNIWRNFDV